MLAIHIANLKMPKQDKWWPFRKFKLVARQFGRERFPGRLWDSSRVMHFCHPRLTVKFLPSYQNTNFLQTWIFSKEKQFKPLHLFRRLKIWTTSIFSNYCLIVSNLQSHKWWNQDRLIRILYICYMKITIPQIYSVQCQPHSSVLTKCTFITVYPFIHDKHTRLNILISSRVD